MINQYYIIEIQQYENGECGHIVHYAFDEDISKARMKAESKYHQVLAAAAISELPRHSASLIATDGQCLVHQSYVHVIPQPEPEPEPEPTPEPTPDPEPNTDGDGNTNGDGNTDGNESGGDGTNTDGNESGDGEEPNADGE